MSAAAPRADECPPDERAFRQSNARRAQAGHLQPQRPARACIAQFVQTVEAEYQMSASSRTTVGGTSIMGLMMLAASPDTATA